MPVFPKDESKPYPGNMETFLAQIKERTLQAQEKTAPSSPLRYLGQLFGVYLAALVEDELLLIDQHAAHERILFDELLERKPKVEKLLIPLSFTVEADEEEALCASRDSLEKLGFRISPAGTYTYEVSALPEDLHDIAETELILFLKSARGSFAELKRAVTSLKACRMAIKAGAALDPVSAESLIVKALVLPDPRCPHGRPVIVRFSRNALDTLFQRKI
jgi:DNA mismatch repair protein MutL